MTDGEERALHALAGTGIAHTITRHGPVGSLEEAAAARGVRQGDDVVRALAATVADIADDA